MLQRITLHLARNKGFPDGSSERGYEILAPLDASGHLDAEVWKKVRNQCTVRRVWVGESDREGHLIHHAGGEGGATWKIHYPRAINGDETGHRLGAHSFALDEYMSIHDEAGHSQTFKVARISSV